MVELVPSAMVAGGSALARDADGQVVFVNGALPGERVHVEIETARRGYRTARLLDVVEASPDRVAPPCPELARGCGACQWQHIEVGAQRTLKRDIVLDAIARIANIDEPEGMLQPTIGLPPWEYRTTVRAAVQKGRAGFRRARLHDSLAIDSCMVMHPLLVPLMT